MKKEKKLNLKFRDKVKRLRLGDRVWVNYFVFDAGAISKDGIVEDIGKDYIVIDKYLIHNYELININKI